MFKYKNKKFDFWKSWESMVFAIIGWVIKLFYIITLIVFTYSNFSQESNNTSSIITRYIFHIRSQANVSVA